MKFYMKKEFILGKKELTCTFINLIVVKMFFTYPRMMVNNSGNAAWIQMIYAAIVSFFIFLIINFLNKHSEMGNIFEIAEKTGGNFLRIVVGIVIILALTANLAVNMRIFPESVRTVLLPETPTEAIVLLYIAAISIGAYMGIYSICRIHSLFMPIVAMVMGLFFLMLIPDINIKNIFPLAGKGTYKLFIDGFSSVSLFSDMMLIYIILPFCKNKRDTKQSISYSFIISGISSVLMLLVYCLVYPYPISKEFILPVYQLARIVNIGQYFQRFDAFFEFSWSIAMMLYSSFYLFVICYAFSETFKVRYYRQLILPIVLLAACIGFVPTNFVTFLSDSYYISAIMAAIIYLVPGILGVLYGFKQKRMCQGGKI